MISLSPIKSPTASPVLSPRLGFPKLNKSPRSSNQDHSPESSISPKPILNNSLPSHSALCNSPVEPESDQYGKQIPIDYSNIIKQDNLIVFKGFTQRSPKQEISKTTKSSLFRFGLSPLEAIEESSCEEFLRKDIKKISHKSQYASPRMICDRTANKKIKKKKKTAAKPNIALRKSPYSEILQLSPQKLPALKNAGKTLKIAKSFSSIKRKKEIINNNLD